MNEVDILIRETDKSDLDDILKVEKEAFGYDKEAELVNELLKDKSAEPVLSLLAFIDNKAAGHILFTRAKIEGSEESPLIYILAPLAVLPEHQKKGIGGMLIKEGIKKLSEMNAEMVFVLGHIEYYPKYGFVPDAGSMGYPAPYPIPAEFANAWMVQALTPKGLSEVKGRVICADELNKPQHWRE